MQKPEHLLTEIKILFDQQMDILEQIDSIHEIGAVACKRRARLKYIYSVNAATLKRLDQYLYDLQTATIKDFIKWK